MRPGVALVSGEKVLGLEVRRECGAGGFGAVYEAWDPALSRSVAVKVLHSAEPRVRRRFRDEGRALARLSHPNIVQVYAVGELPSGHPALVMQFVPGGSLAEHLPPGEAMATLTAATLVAQVLEALAAAHAAGICHRDVKPANVLWSPGRERALLCDFGIARLLDAPPTEPTAGLVGSRQSLAPERLRGVADDPRSDLFAAGALLYRVLSGRDPFDGPPGDLLALAARMAKPPAPLPTSVPGAVARVCHALLQYAPEARPQAADAALMLRAALALPDTLDTPRPPAVSGKPRLGLLLGASAAVALGLAGLALLEGQRHPAASPRPAAEPTASPAPEAEGAAVSAAATDLPATDTPATAPNAPTTTPTTPPTTPTRAEARPPATRTETPSPATRTSRAPRNQPAVEHPIVEPSP